ncbi:hypothetical protein TrVGV298_000895 [Trichoderma virens]|nr:hypothetical protein TrVGV298_000895 [Trichoderma virens]
MPRQSLSQNEKRRRQNRESQRRYREKVKLIIVRRRKTSKRTSKPDIRRSGLNFANKQARRRCGIFINWHL